MQAGETRMGFPGGQGRMSPLEVQRLSLRAGGVAEIQSSTAAAASGHVALATTTTISTCHQVLSSNYDNNNSQQPIYSADQQQVGALTNNFAQQQQQQHVTPPPQPPVTGATHGHHEHKPQHHSAGRPSHQHHNTSTNENYLHLHQATSRHHQQHSNLVRKQQHKHPSHNNHRQQHTSNCGASRGKQQIAEYAVQRAAEHQRQAAAATITASQQSLMATTPAPATTTTTMTIASGRACSPVMLSSPETTQTQWLVTGEGGVVVYQSTHPMAHCAPQPRARVNSISAPRRQVTPTSYSPTPRAGPHVRSLSFSATSASDALLSARCQLQPASDGSGELFCLSDTSATYPAHAQLASYDPYAATTGPGGYQTPSLLSSSACSSIGSPGRPASLLNSQQSPSPAPPPVTHTGAGGGSILYCNNGQQQHQHQQPQQYLHTTPVGPVAYRQHASRANHHSYGGGHSSAPSGGSSTISTSDSLNMSINLEQYISKRNERERSRVRNVNDAFDHLKNSLPLEMEKMSKRMSKVEILRTAIGYIRDLEHILGCSSADQKGAPPGGNRNRQRSFGVGSEPRDHQQQVVASAKAARREFGSGQTGSQQVLLAGENRGVNFATGPELHNLQHQHQQRQPFQPDLNHNNHYLSSYTFNNGNCFRDYEGQAKSGAHDCRHDQQQLEQQQQPHHHQILMNFEEY